MTDQQGPVNSGHAVFDAFVLAQTCKEVQQKFSELCRHLELDAHDYRHFYSKLKAKLNYWKAKELWQKIDKRAAHPDYEQGKPCANTKCLVLGAGPCGLRTAIELALLGAKVVLLEKRTSFSRNNVLHLWPYTIRDLRNLGAKKFYGKFCSGALDHISIRQLQLILLKLALLLGVEVHTGVTYNGLVEPQGSGTGWRALLHPESHPAFSYQFDVFISAGGGRFVPVGFKRKELRGKLAIGITANFVNHRTTAEAQVPEISGVARIYNQKFFQQLQTDMGIDLENIVYYKDDTHYFVMTAKKNSLLKKGVIKQDHANAEQLLAPANVDEEALLNYAYDAAAFSTGHQLPNLEFTKNSKGEADVAMFDFTCMHRANPPWYGRRGKKLLIGLGETVGESSFLAPGDGNCAWFSSAFDTAWMVRNWGKGMAHMQVLAERDVSTLDEHNAAYNNQLAFDILQKEFGITPIMSASDIASSKEIDQLSVVLYLTQVHNAFTEAPKPAEQASSKFLSLAKTRSAVIFLNKLKHNSLQRRKERLAAEREEKERDMREEEEKKELVLTVPVEDVWSSELCYFCHQQLYVLERDSAEGKFFHRSCFTCHQCGTTLRQGGYTFHTDTGNFYCEQHSELNEKNKEKRDSEHSDLSAGAEELTRPHVGHNEQNKRSDAIENEQKEESVFDITPQKIRSVKRKGSYKISIDPDCEETTESNMFTEQEDQLVSNGSKDAGKPGIPTELSTVRQTQPNDINHQTGEESSPPITVSVPVPAPRCSRVPVPKPRTIHNVVSSPTKTKDNQDPTPPSPSFISVPIPIPENDEDSPSENGLKMDNDFKPKLSLKKLQLTAEEKTHLMDFACSQDSDSETPASSSSTSSSSRPQDGGGAEEEGYSSGGASWGNRRQKKLRRGLKKKEVVQRESQLQQGRVRSKFSPWNLSSPRLQQRFSVLRIHPSVNLSKAEKQELMKMKTLERRAKMSELQRLRKAQSIQRRLEEIEVTFKDLEEKGVVLERSLRGQAGADASTVMIDQWIDLVQQKNALVSEESDLMVASRQLELEDKQSMLELELRRFMEIEDMRNSLVSFLEEKRIKEMEEEHLGSSLRENRRQSTAGAQVHWA
ncbi:[F-actin]-methionine sulfoxide oxidase mical1 [Bagarius yarrelli]|uniref:[F-actin]-methionine sulfoxide oxidase mical1 n=1 Tax=Bagarius yarrelli TaxID=175774 RepID=A0A556V2X8_BAGYA|nr:[F-actin]-methionine sulfoxide oxidase mical1 [Bagarius yarrelli]